MSWYKDTLGAVSENIQTGPFGSQLHQSDYRNKGVPVIMPKDMIEGRISTLSIARISEEHVERLNQHKVKSGDIIYSRRGDVGKCALITNKEEDWLCGTGCLKVTLNPNKIIPKFAFYQLQRKESIGWLINHAVGSTMLNLNTSILTKLPIEITDLDKQQSLVNVLTSYDELIENNQKQIKLLEEATQRLYKEWFIDLQFPGHENVEIVDGVPEGWNIRPFNEVFSYVRGKSYKSSELSESEGVLLVNLKNINAFGGYKRNAEKRYIGTYKADQRLDAGDIVMGVTDMTQERRLVGHVAIVPDLGENMTFSMDLIKLIPKSVTGSYLYSAMRFGRYSEQISPFANGVNVLHLKPEAIMSMIMVVPSKDVLERYENIFESYRKKIELLEKLSNYLTEARDRLLPKLMGGEIEV